MPASAPDFRPHLFGKFYVLQRLARGGMAEVYRAKVMGAGGFEKELALKRILAHRAQDAGFIGMLLNEAKLTAQLTHSNIAQIHECGAVDGTWFIALELVNGISMKEMMVAFARAGAILTPEQSIYIVLQLLQGLDYAHRKTDASGEPLHIIHCDVSPDNALVSWEGEVKLLDFGIARAAAGLSNYKEGMLMGKLGYVAPEQASVDRAWDHRVDIFAAGIILYELLTGHKPFPKATDVDSLVASRKQRVAAPSAVVPRLPREIDTILARALAYDPQDRFPSARAFADALVDVLFPTPQSGIQDLLGKQIRGVFADAIVHQREARAHDALVQKVLQKLAEKQRSQPADEQPSEAEPQLTSLADPSAQPSGATPARRAMSRPRTAPSGGRLSLRRAAGMTLALGLLGAGTAWATQSFFGRGVVVVTSTPTGARVAVDGRALDVVTPAVLDEFRSSQPLSLTVSAPDHRPLTVQVDGDLRHSVRRVNVELTPATGPLVVVSDPPGARVRVDGEEVGATPITLPRVRLDERHRVDLTLPGHELDEVVILPDVDGQRVSRKLVRAAREAPGIDLRR